MRRQLFLPIFDSNREGWAYRDGCDKLREPADLDFRAQFPDSEQRLNPKDAKSALYGAE